MSASRCPRVVFLQIADTSKYFVPSQFRTVNVVLTRFNMEKTLALLTACLSLMPNLHTLHVLDANPQMTNIIKCAFDGLVLSNVRTVIIPATCHELLKSCPNVERVWCTQGSGSKLVTVINKFCRYVTEVRGFRCEECPTTMQRKSPFLQSEREILDAIRRPSERYMSATGT